MTSTGTIVLRHLGYHGIAPGSALDALSDAARRGERADACIDQQALVAQARISRDWADPHRNTLAAYEHILKPLLDAHPDHRLAYFGTVPIPLAMLIGMQVSTWRSVDVYQHHHVRKDWLWTAPDGAAPAVHLDLDHLPNRPSVAECEVVLRVSVSYRVDARLTQAVCPTAFEIDLGLDPTQTDLDSPAAVEEVARRFREALDAIQDRVPRARVVHVFASVPVGVAFRMGTMISPTMHAKIQTYELDRAGIAEGYYRAFVLQGAPLAVTAPTADEQAKLAVEREVWQGELGQLEQLAAELRSKGGAWLDQIDGSCTTLAGRRWDPLPPLHALRGMSSHVEQEVTAVSDGFTFDAGKHAWGFDDGFLLSIMRRLPDEGDRRRAARIFLLHESVHDAQCLTRGVAAQVGRFGKVLEEADYQADVWSFLYEYRLAVADRSKEQPSPSPFFRELIRVAMEGMMGFDDAAGVSDEMQARRISRYLIWSWQWLELERARTLDECLAVLFEKPAIELAGLRTSTVDRRILCTLREELAVDLEIAVLRRTRLYRYAKGPAARLDLVLKALRDHDASALREHLRAIADAVLA